LHLSDRVSHPARIVALQHGYDDRKFQRRRNISVPRSFRLPESRREWLACNRSSPMWMLLLVPFIGLLWVPFYNSLEPTIFGFPFFYWYQLAWVPITSLLIWLVYRAQPRDEAP
jgi:uncharacterized membrane protein